MKTFRLASSFLLPILATLFFSLFPLEGKCQPPPRYYLVRKTVTVRNGVTSSGRAEIFTLRDTRGFGNLSFRTVWLKGAAPLTLPAERDASKQAAMDDAMMSYVPEKRDVMVLSGMETGPGRPGMVTRVVIQYLFTPPREPVRVAVKGYTLRVSFRTSVSRVDNRFFELFPDTPGRNLAPGLKEICHDLARRLFALRSFLTPGGAPYR